MSSWFSEGRAAVFCLESRETVGRVRLKRLRWLAALALALTAVGCTTSASLGRNVHASGDAGGSAGAGGSQADAGGGTGGSAGQADAGGGTGGSAGSDAGALCGACSSGEICLLGRCRTPSSIAEEYLKASNTGVGDYFGCSVSVSGNTLAVGANGESSAATGVNGKQADKGAAFSGAVYVFVRTGNTWSQQAFIKASNTGTGDEFGSSVSLSGDTLAVGAHYEGSTATGVNGSQTNSGVESGAVYVFTRTDSTWSQQAYIKASNTDLGDQFGGSVSLSGDTLAVGAHYESSAATGINGNQADNSALESGAVYVFTRTGSTWSQQAYIKASNADEYDDFGGSMSLSGDTLAVGAYKESSAATGVNGNQADDSAVESGAVYVFTRTGSTWSQQAYIKASNTDPEDFFGGSVSVSGNALAVGANGEWSAATGVNGNQTDNSLMNSGAAYVFVRNGSTWSQQAYIKASNPGLEDWFGTSVSLSGDTLAVGADNESSAATGVDGNQADNSADGSGAVYVF